MKKTLIRIALAAFICTATLPITALGSTSPLEDFRSDLLQYVDDLRRVPTPVMMRINEEELSLDEAEASIRNLNDAELMTLQESMSRVPFWRELPAALANMNAGATRPAPRAMADQIGAGPADHQAVRAQLLALVAAMRAVPQEMVSDGYAGRVDRIEQAILSSDEADIVVLGNELRARLPQIEAKIESRRLSSNGIGGGVEAAANCGTTFPTSILCEIENVINEITKIPDYVEGFANHAIDTIEQGLQALFSTLNEAIPTATQIVDRIGLSDPNWWTDLGSTISGIASTAPLCPAAGTNIPGIGTVGDIRATVTCKRGVEWVSSALYDLAPDDVWGVSLKTPFAFLYYPVNYLCTCYEEASDNAFDVAQAAHRDLVEERLNTTVSSRSTQTSVDNANIGMTSLDNDVAALETKLDLIETKTDNILINAGNTSEFLVQFRDQALRLRIEADLFRDGNTKIVLFQMPSNAGGYLELARSIVNDTITRRTSNGAEMRTALRSLAEGDRAYTDGSYKAAYDHYRKAYRAATR